MRYSNIKNFILNLCRDWRYYLEILFKKIFLTGQQMYNTKINTRSNTYLTSLGNIMTLSYTTGLTIGSLLAYMMDACLGPPVQIKDVCLKTAKVQTSTTVFSNVTTSILTTAVSSTLPIVEKTTAISKPKTTDVLTTILMSTLLSNSTVSDRGLSDASTTALPKILANVTSASNAILQH